MQQINECLLMSFALGVKYWLFLWFILCFWWIYFLSTFCKVNRHANCIYYLFFKQFASELLFAWRLWKAWDSNITNVLIVSLWSLLLLPLPLLLLLFHLQIVSPHSLLICLLSLSLALFLSQSAIHSHCPRILELHWERQESAQRWLESSNKHHNKKKKEKPSNQFKDLFSYKSSLQGWHPCGHWAEHFLKLPDCRLLRGFKYFIRNIVSWRIFDTIGGILHPSHTIFPSPLLPNRRRLFDGAVEVKGKSFASICCERFSCSAPHTKGQLDQPKSGLKRRKKTTALWNWRSKCTEQLEERWTHTHTNK